MIQDLKKSAKKPNFKCEVCRDAEMVETENGWRVCDCKKKAIAQKKMQQSGFTPGLMTLKDFKVKDDISRKMRAMAEKHISDPEKSMAILGQVGSGKTHICVAAAQELINQGRDVVYMPYAELIIQLKQNMFNQDEYNKTIKSLKTCETLVIDDLFKGAPKPNDIDIVFQIINYRYLNKKPIIISSEKIIQEIIDIDEAIGSRIREMAKDNAYQVARNKENNRRMK